ncbi:MAG: hypothetical protein HUJ75_07835, partial [Parasporobacterium sp.]|nr:hypothetical protein [Parasporobacterium sp.]
MSGKENLRFEIDNITWNDLGMDEVFKRLDHAGSSVGSEYIKNSLKSLHLTEEPLKVRDEKAGFLTLHPERRPALVKIFKGLGKIKKVSFLDYIFRLEELTPQKNTKHIILIILLLCAVGLLFISPAIGIISVIVMFAVNISIYFKDKSKVEGYFQCIKYLASMVICAGKLVKELSLPAYKDTSFEKDCEELKELHKRFASINRFSFLITNSVSGSIADVLMDYVRMLFHVDIIKFNNSRKTAIENKESIFRLYEIIGELELALCIDEFRKEHISFCKPVFKETLSISFKDAVHPLLKEPVPNSLEAHRSVLLTGSNASGKSTFLKATAINQIFAQSFYTCLASEFETVFAKVLSSIALNDNILAGESYFVVEIKSLKRILDSISDVPVICFVDEVLRGTNTAER